MFGISAPEQLKKKLIRTARLTRMDNELAKYEKAFGKKCQKEDNTNMVLLWNNGLGLVKHERMLAEFSKSLLRVALKQVVVQEAAKEDQGLRIALQVIGAVIETADSRN
ncbi:MAG: hypothetical protein KTR26_09720 [Flammeovirgaceae bacterium]|nr:hypothetical protein [Flammeovirgaceae bacterium]